jgi:PAS domain S-box-containing protein
VANRSSRDRGQDLRAEAEARFSHERQGEPLPPAAPEILHELHVQKVMLEIQHEELRRTVLAVEEAFTRYSETYEHAPVGFVTVDREGIVANVNRPAAPLLGVDRRSIQGQKLAAFFDPTDAERWDLAFNRALKGGEKLTMEVKLRRPDGTHAYSWLQLVPARIEEAPVVHVAVSDVTELKLAEEALRASQAQLAVAARLAGLGTLVAGVSHEINNPLASTVANTQLALEALRPLRDRLRESAPAEVLRLDAVIEELADALEGGRRIGQIVKDLQTFGRPDASKTRVRLVDVVEQALHWLPTSVGPFATVSVENGNPPDIIAAFGQIEQVVLNLVTNAAKASRLRESGRVIVRMGPGDEGKARLDVIDNGVGIDSKIMSRIFEPFFTTGGIGEGMGLGLAICHAIVESHGGELTVESEVGKGSTFRVELPAAPAGA